MLNCTFLDLKQTEKEFKQIISSKGKQTVEENKILDLSPTQGTAITYDFRPRHKKQQIQPGMKFASRSISETKLPSIHSAKQQKLRFKGVEQMGNKLKTMEQNEDDVIGLVNRLQTVSGGKQIDHVGFSLMALRQSKLLTAKHKK